MVKVLELFAGIGACSKALERVGIEHELVDAVEIDKYAIKSFNAIHGTNFETQDITKWDKDIECDLIMHGSPCQDFSLAGKQAGGDMGSGTRSSLMYETIRIVGKLRPKYVIWENVKNVLSAKHKHNFENYLTAMSSLGYTNFHEVLNAKDFGIPQNRERVFTISILSGNEFEFPPKHELKLRLKDMLEDEVDEKYYLSDEQVEKIKTSTFHTNARRIQEKDWCDTLCARDWKDPKCVEVSAKRLFNIYGDDKGTSFAGNVWDKEAISPTLTNMQGGNRQPMIIGSTQEHSAISTNGIAPTLTSAMGQGGGHVPMMLIKNATKKGYTEAYEGDSVNLAYPDSATRRGRVGDQVAQTLQCNDNMGVVTYMQCRNRQPMVIQEPMIYDDRDKGFGVKITDICPTQRAMRSGIKCICPDLRIRKLTPKECWRLMGFDDEDFEKAAQVNSNTQLYKQAGNSIVVNVLESILRNLIKE